MPAMGRILGLGWGWGLEEVIFRRISVNYLILLSIEDFHMLVLFSEGELLLVN